MAAVTRAAAACCLLAFLLSCCVPTVSGAWPWELSLQKNKTTTTEAPTPKTSTVTTGSPSTTTPTPPTAESPPRLRSRGRSHPKKHHFHTTTTSQPTTKDPTTTTTTTEDPSLSVPPAAVQMAPQFFASVQPELSAGPPPEMSPLVIVEPDSYPDAARPYRSMYGQPFGGMFAPPVPYAPPMPYYSPPLAPQMAAYPSPYDPYAAFGYPSFQWPNPAPYLRPYRSYPFAPGPSLGGYSPYPWLKPQIQELTVGADGIGGCSSEPKGDREELAAPAPADQKVEEPAPTYVSLLPSFAGKVPSFDTPIESNPGTEKPYTLEQKGEQPNVAPVNNAYGVGEIPGKENHILRNNPYQPAPPGSYYPGYYDQSQWPQWNQWQQWPGYQPQQAQYPYGVTPQQPTVEQSQKRQALPYGWPGQQYA